MAASAIANLLGKVDANGALLVTVSGGVVGPVDSVSFSGGSVLVGTVANDIFQRNGTNAQRLSVANTYTSSTNYEAFSVDWQTQSNIALIGTRTAASGTGREVYLAAQANAGANDYIGLRAFRQSATPLMLGYYNAVGTPLSFTAFTTMVTIAEGTNTATSGTFSTVALRPTYNQASGTAANTDLLINRTQTAVGSGAQLLQDWQVSTTPQLSLTNVGKFSVYNAVATAGQGVEVIRAQATTGTVTNAASASIATWTPGAADVEVEVSARVNITTSTTHSFSIDVTYTDVANNARTRVLMMYPISGTPLTSGLMTNTVGVGDFASAVTRIGVKASTAITVRTSAGGTFTTVVYTASGTIKQVG